MVDVDIMVRSMGPVSEADMVCNTSSQVILSESQREKKTFLKNVYNFTTFEDIFSRLLLPPNVEGYSTGAPTSLQRRCRAVAERVDA